MKLRKNSTKALMLAALMVLGILSNLPVSTQPYTGWLSYNPFTFTETAGIDRVNEPVDVFFYPSPGNCSSPNEIRVIAPNNSTEPSQVYNVTMEGGYVRSCNVVFRVNCPAYSSVTYYIVYNNPSARASAPSYTTDLKLKTVPQAAVTEITARINNAKYSAYVGREGSIGGTETGKEVYIKDWNPSQTIFVYSGCAWIPWANQYWFLDYDGRMSLVRNGSVFVDLNAPAIWKGAAVTTGGLLNFTSKLRFYARNSWFTNTLTAYTTGTKTYKWLKPNVATDQAYMALAVYPNMTGGRHISTKNVNMGGATYINFTYWDNTWVDYANSSSASNSHGFAILNLPGGTPWTGLGKTPGSSGTRGTGDSWTMYWAGSGAVFTANLVLGFHANSNYTYAEDLYDRLNKSLQSTLEVGTENGAPTPSFSLPSGWSDYTPINVTEIIGKARTFEPVDVLFMPGANNIKRAEEVRVYTSGGVEIPSQVYDTTFGGTPPNQYITSLRVVFLANVTANTETTYYIIYNNPSATTLPAWYKTWSDLTFSTQPLGPPKPGYYTVDAANTYYNSTGELWGSGAMSHVKVLGHSSTLDVMGSVFLPALRLPNMPYGEGYFGFWSLSGNSTIVRKGPVFADVLTKVSDFGLAQGFRKSGVNNYTIMLRYYAYTPWVTATITYNANGTVNYELMEIAAKVSSTKTSVTSEGIPWLTRPNAAGVPQTFNMSLKPGGVTTDASPRNLTWTADWDKTWVDFQNKTASNNPVGAALINLDGAGTTTFVGLKSESGDEGSPYWNGTCTTKKAKLAVGFHTGSNYTYAQNLYARLTNPLTVSIGNETSYFTEFSLVTLYKARLKVHQRFLNGTQLRVKFYTYDGTYKGESTVWTGATPTLLTFSVDIPHPLGKPVENATLVLTDNLGNVLQTVKSFLVRRPTLFSRTTQIIMRWPLATSAERITLFKELTDISKQWPYAPA